MSTINQINIIGNLTNTPEIKEGANGMKIAIFTLATNHVYQGPNGEKKDEAEYHACVAYGGVVEIIGKYAKKGQKNYVQGRLRTRSWDDATTGQKRYKTEIVVEKFVMLSKKENDDYSDLI